MKHETIVIQKELFDAEKSKFRKYCELVVGKSGLLSFLKHEFVMAFACAPGAVGLLLRAKLYPLVLKRCGDNVNFGMGVVLRHPHKIEIGTNVVIDDFCLLDAKGTDNSGIEIGNGVFLGRNSILSCKNGDIVLKDEVNIGFNCEVFSASKVILEQSVLVAAYTYLVGGGHDFDSTETHVLAQGRSSKGITVDRGAWLGAGARILDGVRIGRDSIIGANAVVTKDVPEYAIVGGVPAAVIRDRLQQNQDE